MSSPRATALILTLLFGSACFDDAPAASEPAAAPSPAQPAAEAAPTATAKPAKKGALPDLTAQLVTGACENGPGNEGADSHFTGTFQWNGDTVSGTERWLLHANSKWKQRGGSDCTITWYLSGSKVNTQACADCDFGLMLSAEPDIAGSDCPEGLVKADAKKMELRYDLKLQSDGTAFVYFAKSGRRLGQGYHTQGSANWVSQHQCKWF